MEGPEIEYDLYNFEKLNIPADHPAKDEQDTFYINKDIVLRNNTSPVQARVMEQGKLPIVAMTANAFAEDVQLAKNTGMNGHIAKPLDMNKLNDVLENWL